jgi:hypothetical protein
MGLVRCGIPQELTLTLKTVFGIEDFIETGTFLGGTSAWAAGHFARVVTVEAAPKLHAEAQRRHGHLNNIEFILGDSREGMARVVPALARPALFWLDGHWSCEDTAGEGDECPLAAELEILARSPLQHFVLIDDARLFAAPPPAPLDPTQWPTLDAVMDGLRAGDHRPYIVMVEDVIVAVPQKARPIVAAYCRRDKDPAWNDLITGVRMPPGFVL